MTQSNSDLAPEKPLGKPDALARRTRLREFQTQLFARMQAAKSGSLQANQLGVMMGQQRFLLSLQEAGEIVSVGTITKVPLTQDWFLGLTNIRGNLISVIDFARFQGMAPTVIDKESRIVSFSSALSFNCGLLVTRVLGLRTADGMQAQENSGDQIAWAPTRYVDRDANTWTELNLSAVVQDPRFLQVGL